MSAWATDVSVTETFSGIEQIAAVSSDEWNADICTWSTAYTRHRSGATYIDPNKVDPQTNEDIISVNSSPMYSVWMSAAVDNKRGCIQTTNWEGGIKAVSFRWAQFGAESSNRLALEIKAGEIQDDSITNVNLKRNGNDGENRTTGGIEYTHIFECKSNGQLSIKNISKKGGNRDCRILIGHITITPYLRYMQKEVTIGLLNNGYINRNLLNQIEEGHTITYSIEDERVAEINSSTGAITPKAAGTTIVKATWTEEGAYTTYKLNVVDNQYLETFNKNEQEATSPWSGDIIPTWDVNNVNRRPQDTLGINIQGTYVATTGNNENNQGYLATSAGVVGGVKAVDFDWKQWNSAKNSTLRIKTLLGGTQLDLMEQVGSAGVVYRGHRTATNPSVFSNAVLEIRNTSTKGSGSGDPNPRVVIGDVLITPWLLYRTTDCTLDMQTVPAETTFTNGDLINNTTNAYGVEYSIISNESGINVDIDEETGEVTVADRFQTGTITVQAAWSEVTTTYTLHILGKTETTASYAISSKKIGLDGDATNNITKPEDYDGTISYASSNTDVVQVVNNELRVVGVGVTTITATLPETELFSGTSASYTLYVRDANARKEQFSIVTATGVVGTTLTQWAGDLFEWQAQYQVRRGTNDTIHAGISKHQGTSIGIQDPTGTPLSSILQSKGAVEGGIKYLTFYWMQWGAAGDGTRRIAVYADDELIGYQENPNGASGKTGDEFMLGINNAMKSNKQLVIKNESYMGETYETKTSLSTADNSSRIVIGVIEITPYLFYSDKAHTMRLGDAPYTHSLTNNTGGNNISYSLVPDDSEVASIDPSTGEVTALKAGEVTIKATWDDEGAGAYTTYHLSIKPKLTSSTKVETFPNATDYTYKVGGVDNNIQQSQCKWIVREAGFNSNENFEANVAFIRQKYDGQAKQSYIQTDENISGGINTLSFDWNIVGNEPDVTEWDIIAQIKQDDVVKKEIHLLSSAGGVLENVHKRNNGWRSTVLTDIDVTGDFIIRFENHSTINGTYTSGNKARFVIDNVEWKAANDISLVDEDDNTEIIRDNDGKVADVQLADRTIRTGGYNTLCLPFAVSEETLQATLPGAKAYEFTNAYLSETNLDIRFNKVNALEAGKPYLVTVPENVANPVFESVTINSSTTNNITKGENMWFRGSYNAVLMNGTGLYVVANSLYRVSNISEQNSANKIIGACRAYFDVPEGAPALGPVRMRIIAGTNTATDIDNGEWTNGEWTNGRKILRDGQLIIIRGDKEYNAQGQIVKTIGNW